MGLAKVLPYTIVDVSKKYYEERNIYGKKKYLSFSWGMCYLKSVKKAKLINMKYLTFLKI